MPCNNCGARRGHLSGCASEGRGKTAIDASLSSREKKALKEENPAGRGAPKARKTRAVVTGRALKAQKAAAKKIRKEGGLAISCTGTGPPRPVPAADGLENLSWA